MYTCASIQRTSWRVRHQAILFNFFRVQNYGEIEQGYHRGRNEASTCGQARPKHSYVIKQYLGVYHDMIIRNAVVEGVGNFDNLGSLNLHLNLNTPAFLPLIKNAAVVLRFGLFHHNRYIIIYTVWLNPATWSSAVKHPLGHSISLNRHLFCNQFILLRKFYCVTNRFTSWKKDIFTNENIHTMGGFHSFKRNWKENNSEK